MSRGSQDDAPRLVRIPNRAAWAIYHRGRRISTGTPDRTEAQAALTAYRRSLDAPDPKAPITLATILARYLADRIGAGKVSATRIEWAHKPVIRHLGTRLPAEFDDNLTRAYTADRVAEGVLPSTVRIELQAVSTALRWAAGKRLIAAAPKVELPPKPEPRDRWLTRAEAERLVDGAHAPHVKLFVLLGLHTAARKKAILDLTWDRVDLVTRRIDMRDPEQQRTTKRRVRIPINDTLLPVLEAAHVARTTAWVVEYGGKRLADVRHGFDEAASRAGLRRVTPHTLRHTAITWMMQAGVSPFEVGGFAGCSARMIEETYGHHAPEFMNRAARALG